MAQAAQTHGLEAYDAADRISYIMHDHWQGLLAALGNPWPDSRVSLKVQFRPRTFDARATFLAGDHDGTTWGMQSWSTYQQQGSGPAEFSENSDAQFILPAMQYLLEFPFRGLNAGLVAYAGVEVIGDVSYERVFVTWNSFDAHSDADQYVVYINPETHRIEKLAYTVREFAGFAKGAVHYRDFQSVGGVLIPMTQTVTGAPTDDLSDYLHEMTIEPGSVVLDGDASVFDVDANRAQGADKKPA